MITLDVNYKDYKTINQNVIQSLINYLKKCISNHKFWICPSLLDRVTNIDLSLINYKSLHVIE